MAQSTERRETKKRILNVEQGMMNVNCGVDKMNFVWVQEEHTFITPPLRGAFFSFHLLTEELSISPPLRGRSGGGLIKKNDEEA
jgi:hypothetical protein